MPGWPFFCIHIRHPEGRRKDMKAAILQRSNGGKIMAKHEDMQKLEQMVTVGVECENKSDVYTIPDFVRASESTSDPIGRYKGDWGFWDECWCDWHGGYADEAAARRGLAEYVQDVLGG